MDELNIGTKISGDYVSKVACILAKRDSGKTYTAGVIEEQMFINRLPFVVIDPMNAHWGIRSKFPITIFGGPKADIDITSNDGAPIAKLIVSQNLSGIIDVSDWSFEDMQLFVTEFGDKLYELNTTPRHLIVEEADIFAPQRPDSNSKVSLRALDTIVRRGRQRGLGVTLITQRPAVLNKNVLTQSDVFFFMNVVAEQDIKVVGELLNLSGLDRDTKKEHIAKIMKYKQGECMLFSPSWLRRIESFKVSKRQAHHAGATVGMGKKEEVKLVPVIIDHIVKALNTEGGTESDIGITMKHPTMKQYGTGIVMLTALMFMLGAMI